MKQADKFPSLL